MYIINITHTHINTHCEGKRKKNRGNIYKYIKHCLYYFSCIEYYNFLHNKKTYNFVLYSLFKPGSTERDMYVIGANIKFYMASILIFSVLITHIKNCKGSTCYYKGNGICCCRRSLRGISVLRNL